MNWDTWNKKQEEKEKKLRRLKKFTTNIYGNIGNSFKSQNERRRNRLKQKLKGKKKWIK